MYFRNIMPDMVSKLSIYLKHNGLAHYTVLHYLYLYLYLYLFAFSLGAGMLCSILKSSLLETQSCEITLEK